MLQIQSNACVLFCVFNKVHYIAFNLLINNEDTIMVKDLTKKEHKHLIEFVTLCGEHLLIPSQVAFDLIDGTGKTYNLLSIKEIEQFILNNY
jgi:hypothetical protein